MKKKSQFIVLRLVLLLLVSYSLSSHAQVTIGSNDAPLGGALLQLKENETTDGSANSTRGLGMPRVKLTDKNKLQPMYSYVDAAHTPTATDVESHIGLVVYHIDKCTFGGTGLYVWDGVAWQRLPKNGLTGSLFFNQDYFDFSSGLDARGAVAARTLTAGWSLSGNLAYSKVNTLGGGVPFSGANALPASPWATNPTAISLLPDAMTATDVTAANPWKSKETKLNFVDTDCGNATKTITLNQTNYAIQSFNNAKGAAGAINTLTTASTFIRLTDTNAKTFRIKSNAAWKTTVANPSNIFSHTIPATGGADLTNGTTPPNNDYALTGIAGTGTKYQTATITIEDNSNPKRAKDVIVTCLSCIGTDPSFAGLQTETAANSNRADWAAAWGAKVIRHQAKTNVYEEFTSADFGAAGRWMTTNLSAKAYDGITHNHNRVLQVMPNGYISDLHNVAYWGYPNTDGVGKPQQSTEYNKNKSLGLLYTWDAATAGKGGATGETVFGVSPNFEAGVNHATPQGVCPQGWHLPSDYEWTQLENAIIQKTSQYSNLADIDSSNANTLPQNTAGTGAWRGTAHGTAMKEICETSPSYDPQGASKPASQGGFSSPLAGYAHFGRSGNFGSYSYFLSSSSYDKTYAWTRVFYYMHEGVSASGNGRNGFFSVRCKKN